VKTEREDAVSPLGTSRKKDRRKGGSSNRKETSNQNSQPKNFFIVEGQKIDDANYSCPMIHQCVFVLHERVQLSFALNSLISSILNPFAVSNRKNMFVYRDSIGNIFYFELDGRSSEWGFSLGDQVANISGYAAYIAQQKFWNEQRITFKFSYSHTDFPMLNPDLLGRNFQQRIIKDYNAQTYWCSFNVHSFLASDAAFPKWMNLSLGYGASGMTRAEMNDYDVNNFQRTREYYFSFDADLNRIQWPRKWMKKVARVISFIKLPAPTLEVQSDGKVKVYALFF
jgi:hypothetical protein